MECLDHCVRPHQPFGFRDIVNCLIKWFCNICCPGNEAVVEVDSSKESLQCSDCGWLWKFLYDFDFTGERPDSMSVHFMTKELNFFLGKLTFFELNN